MKILVNYFFVKNTNIDIQPKYELEYIN